MKAVEYDRLARKPCRGSAAKVDHLSDVSELPLLNKQRRPRPIRIPLRRSHRTLAVTRTASGRASTADPEDNSNKETAFCAPSSCASCGDTSLFCLRSEATRLPDPEACSRNETILKLEIRERGWNSKSMKHETQ